jgi:membrane protein implicated in regulation of membrane protease activity
MSEELFREWLLNPLLWVSVATLVLILELFVVSGVSLAIGVAGVLVGGSLFVFELQMGEVPLTTAGRWILVTGAVWSVFSLAMIGMLRRWMRRKDGPPDPNENLRGLGVETGEVKTAEVDVPAYVDVLKDYKSRLE